MYLIKSESGLLELENYFATSPIGDLIGDGFFTRGKSEFKVTNGTIERNFPYDNCVIHIEKTPYELTDNSEIWFYLRNEYKNVSLIEKKDNVARNQSEWLLVRYKGFTEFYAYDGEWKHIGGLQHEKYPFQGFKVKGSTPLNIKSYKVFSSPYVTFTNVLPESECTLYENDTVIDSTIANENGEAIFFALHPRRNCTLKVKFQGQLLIQQSTDSIDPGDKFIFSAFNIGLKYMNTLLSPVKTQMLTNLTERIILTNYGSESYENIILKIVDDDNRVLISWDKNFSEELKEISTPLGPLEDKEFYVNIKPYSTNYNIKKFGIFVGGDVPDVKS